MGSRPPFNPARPSTRDVDSERMAVIAFDMARGSRWPTWREGPPSGSDGVVNYGEVARHADRLRHACPIVAILRQTGHHDAPPGQTDCADIWRGSASSTM
jgi:hypothetical protein